MTTAQTSKSWVICPQPNAQAKLRLFCFHYAGGGAWSFRTWSDNLPSSVEVCSVELPGRGFRLTEAAFTNLDPLVQAIADALLPRLDKPFAFFGHSMGGLVSFELTRLLRRNYNLNPVQLYVSGHRAPQLPDPDPPIHNLPEPEFLEELRDLEGTPQAVLENAELMQLLLPTLRADFTVVETYAYTAEPPLDCPITAFGGLQDREVSYDELKAWQEQTNIAFSLHMLPGNHFFLHSAQSLLLKLLSQDLHQLICEVDPLR
ncbi:thioesterase II family protein [Allocoleopsis franciscana]|uniref:Putative thioesterase involved in non-ribosomal peptide biosynthesis n=1 Tax=Allocoleopsis franciscana PCC 7113 TaxID=1173027 RepID=K9WB68_9CYAN|nr:thioesterase II family protein [Allocoleopsis franciscana]AFZ17600.1 putative thioesterase involved in non-ribosomal peptide biosynthesis [Allocoleopsis franciscana PCC 7113]